MHRPLQTSLQVSGSSWRVTIAHLFPLWFGGLPLVCGNLSSVQECPTETRSHRQRSVLACVFLGDTSPSDDSDGVLTPFRGFCQ